MGGSMKVSGKIIICMGKVFIHGQMRENMKDNIDEFEDIPAFVRKSIQINKSGDKDNSEISTFTLSEDDDEPVLRDDNAYLNDNVD